MPDEKPSAPADAARYPKVDRLFELASRKDASSEPRDKSMWKLLLQLRPFLPYLARLVPMLEFAVGPLQSAGLSSDVQKAVTQSMSDSVAKLQSGQRELNTAMSTALDQQSVQLKRLEEEITRLRQVSETSAAEQARLRDDIRSATRLLRIAVFGGAVLLLALIIMAALLLARAH